VSARGCCCVVLARWLTHLGALSVCSYVFEDEEEEADEGPVRGAGRGCTAGSSSSSRALSDTPSLLRSLHRSSSASWPSARRR
jgi:hypothetical protein